jgi:O-antigen ligase
LYAVVVAGTLVHLLPRLLGRRGGYAPSRPPMLLDWLLLTTVVVYGVQAGYSTDLSKAAQNVVFFYVPFGLLYLLLREAPWTARLVLTCLGVATLLAVVFAGVGFVEYYRKALFLNPKVVAANEYDNYFRVNSLFFDPSIYGRFLALVMIASTTVVLWARSRREQLLGTAVLGWLLLGLATSFSQSSIAALLLGLAVLAAWRWDVRGTVYVSVALAAIAAVVVLAAPASLHFGLKGSGGSANNATSGRAKLISGGLKLFVGRPLTGYGSGSFETEYKRHARNTTAANVTSASHTIPVTVAAEQGIVGLALYVALLVAAFLTFFSGAGRSPPRIAIAACFAALVLHTWVYADFLEDPMTWTLLGIGVALGTLTESACATT